VFDHEHPKEITTDTRTTERNGSRAEQLLISAPSAGGGSWRA
jgi:hypothetical protein